MLVTIGGEGGKGYIGYTTPELIFKVKSAISKLKGTTAVEKSQPDEQIRLAFSFLVFLMFPIIIVAGGFSFLTLATTVGGDLTEDTTWTLAESPYVVVEDQSLTI